MMFLKLTEDRRKVEGVSLGGIWIGDSEAEAKVSVDAILNVAQDLRPTRGWPKVETMQVGLIDGPGNEPSAYVAAVLALHSLLKRHNVLVCCHSGSRALAVVLMYLCASTDRNWENWLCALQELVDVALPEVHIAHREARHQVTKILGGMQWRM